MQSATFLHADWACDNGLIPIPNKKIFSFPYSMMTAVSF